MPVFDFERIISLCRNYPRSLLCIFTENSVSLGGNGAEFEVIKKQNPEAVNEFITTLFRCTDVFSIESLSRYHRFWCDFLENFCEPIVKFLNGSFLLSKTQNNFFSIFSHLLLQPEISQKSFLVVQCCRTEVITGILEECAKTRGLALSKDHSWLWCKSSKLYYDVVKKMFSVVDLDKEALVKIFDCIELQCPRLKKLRLAVNCEIGLNAVRQRYKLGSTFGLCKNRLKYARILRDILFNLCLNDNLIIRKQFVDQLEAAMERDLPQNFRSENRWLSENLNQLLVEFQSEFLNCNDATFSVSIKNAIENRYFEPLKSASNHPHLSPVRTLFCNIGQMLLLLPEMGTGKNPEELDKLELLKGSFSGALKNYGQSAPVGFDGLLDQMKTCEFMSGGNEEWVKLFASIKFYLELESRAESVDSNSASPHAGDGPNAGDSQRLAALSMMSTGSTPWQMVWEETMARLRRGSPSDPDSGSQLGGGGAGP